MPDVVSQWDHGDMGDAGLPASLGGGEARSIGRRVPRRFPSCSYGRPNLSRMGPSAGVGAVRQDEHLAVPGRQGAEGRLDGEGAAPLHGTQTWLSSPPTSPASLARTRR
jgi:hypothetical protein